MAKPHIPIQEGNTMKKIALLAVALFALLAVPAVASAAPHHHKHHPKPVHCKSGYHRNGRQCVKNPPGPQKGEKGEKGDTGSQGPAGTTGPAGPKGANGTNGANGKDGTNGNDGATGATGAQGPVGPQGAAGQNGTNGTNGSNGAPGAPGAPGTPGTPGTPGEKGEPAPVSPFTYDNIEPSSFIDNPVSLGYAATGTTEFGSQIVQTEGSKNAEVEVLMSVWGCEQGGGATCVTADPAATFDAPLTLNVYEVTYENKVGALLSSTSETFELSYRPSSAGCADDTAFKAVDGHCQHGLPVGVTFKTGTNLPRKVIITLSFTPSSADNGATQSLNVGLEGPPSVGQNPLESNEGIYWNSAWFGDKNTTLHLETHEGALEDEMTIGEDQIAALVKNG